MAKRKNRLPVSPSLPPNLTDRALVARCLAVPGEHGLYAAWEWCLSSIGRRASYLLRDGGTRRERLLQAVAQVGRLAEALRDELGELTEAECEGKEAKGG